MAELKNALRSGDVSVSGSRQFRAFEEYLMPHTEFNGLLYHESDLRIEEHYTDTAGFTDHVFALCHLLGFRFAPRIRDLADKRLYVPGKAGQWSSLSPLIGGSINARLIERQLGEVLRLAASIQQGTVTASLILRKLGSYPRQNSLALALREIGRIERTLFTLAWIEDPSLRRRVTAGLNKGEARNSLARAVFFNRLGEVRDRSFENQRYRASGLNLVVAAIALWNTVYLERAADALARSRAVDHALFQHVSPLGWEHVNLTGDCTWHTNKRVARHRWLRNIRRRFDRVQLLADLWSIAHYGERRTVGNDSHDPSCRPGCVLCFGRAVARSILARQPHRRRWRSCARRFLRSQGLRGPRGYARQTSARALSAARFC
jgi:hypothetical protein